MPPDRICDATRSEQLLGNNQRDSSIKIQRSVRGVTHLKLCCPQAAGDGEAQAALVPQQRGVDLLHLDHQVLGFPQLKVFNPLVPKMKN